MKMIYLSTTANNQQNNVAVFLSSFKIYTNKEQNKINDLDNPHGTRILYCSVHCASCT